MSNSYTDVPLRIADDERLMLHGQVWRRPIKDPDLDDGLEYMTDFNNVNQYAQNNLGEEWMD
jgi:hypothetical protein